MASTTLVRVSPAITPTTSPSTMNSPDISIMNQICSSTPPDEQGQEAAERGGGHLVSLYHAGEHTIGELEELFGITRSTVYRAIQRAGT